MIYTFRPCFDIGDIVTSKISDREFIVSYYQILQVKNIDEHQGEVSYMMYGCIDDNNIAILLDEFAIERVLVN